MPSEFVPSELASEAIDTPQTVESGTDTSTHSADYDAEGVDTVAIPAPEQLIGKLAHADQLISAVGEARAGLQSERAVDTSEHFGEYGDDMSEFIAALVE